MTRDHDEVLRAFAAEVGRDGPVTVRGGGTRWTVGGELVTGTREVEAPVGVVDLRPDEMTVRVRAGTTVTDLHSRLAGSGQRTVLPERPGGTVGGALAVGENSIARLGRGLTRDALLRAVYVSAEGELVSAGGPTVKNVSGFDLARLLVGSLGTLGLIGEVILRTQPIPQTEEWLRAEVDDPAPILGSAPTAASILWDGHTAWVLLAGFEADVEADRAQLASLGAFGPADPPALPPHRWSRTPSEALAAVREEPGSLVAEAGVGLVHAPRPDGPPRRPAGVRAIEDRIKARFDPTGRLSPGRRPGGH